nr:hypothetical protein L204_00603 [Cryptococcus depauperatus CBS 7855]
MAMMDLPPLQAQYPFQSYVSLAQGEESRGVSGRAVTRQGWYDWSGVDDAVDGMGRFPPTPLQAYPTPTSPPYHVTACAVTSLSAAYGTLPESVYTKGYDSEALMRPPTLPPVLAQPLPMHHAMESFDPRPSLAFLASKTPPPEHYDKAPTPRVAAVPLEQRPKPPKMCDEQEVDGTPAAFASLAMGALPLGQGMAYGAMASRGCLSAGSLHFDDVRPTYPVAAEPYDRPLPLTLAPMNDFPFTTGVLSHESEPGSSDTERRKRDRAGESGGSDGKKRYICGHCNKEFTRINDQKRHILCLHLEPQFACPGCGRKFGRKDKMNEHMRREAACLRFAPPPTARQSKKRRGSKASKSAR